MNKIKEFKKKIVFWKSLTIKDDFLYLPYFQNYQWENSMLMKYKNL